MPQRFSDYSSRRFVPTGQKGTTYKVSMEEARPREALPVVVSGKAGKPLEDLSIEPLSVGIHDVRKVTHPIFCHDHYDSRIFASIGKGKIASRYPMMYTKAQLVTLARFSARGGAYIRYLSQLKSQGYITTDNNRITLTTEGLAATGILPNTRNSQ